MLSFKMPHRKTCDILFRLEAFNSTNTPAWSAPGTSLGTSTFGVITTAASDRLVLTTLKCGF